jgi:hypothetical protein
MISLPWPGSIILLVSEFVEPDVQHLGTGSCFGLRAPMHEIGQDATMRHDARHLDAGALLVREHAFAFGLESLEVVRQSADTTAQVLVTLSVGYEIALGWHDLSLRVAFPITPGNVAPV